MDPAVTVTFHSVPIRTSTARSSPDSQQALTANKPLSTVLELAAFLLQTPLQSSAACFHPPIKNRSIFVTLQQDAVLFLTKTPITTLHTQVKY